MNIILISIGCVACLFVGVMFLLFPEKVVSAYNFILEREFPIWYSNSIRFSGFVALVIAGLLFYCLFRQ